MLFEILLYTLLAIISALCMFHIYIRHGRVGKYIDKLPGPRPLPFIGNIHKYMVPYEQLWHVLRKMNADYYPLYRIWSIFVAVVNIQHPDDVEVILTSMQHIEKSIIYKLLHPWFGTGLLTSAGTKWQYRRKILTPAFHFNILKRYVEIITENGEKTVALLKAEGESVQNLVPFLTNYTLNVICEAAMGISLQEKGQFHQEYRDAIHKMSEIMLYRLLHPWFIMDWLFNLTRRGREQRNTLKILHGFSTKIINERKAYHEETKGEFLKQLSSEGPNDESVEFFGMRKRRLSMLDLLIAANKDGKQIDDLGIREEVDTFMFEGHDTSAMGILFTLLLLAEHKDAQARIRSEVNEVLYESGGKMGISEMQRFCYLERCIKESLRLYPSVPFISRAINEDLHLKKYLIPKGCFAQIHLYDIHRDPNFWPAPNKFDPDRFLPEQVQNQHPFAFIPFSAGPRNCIGQKFAMLELKAIIAHLIHNFYLEPIDLAHEVPIVCDLVIRPARPVHIKFVPIQE